MLLIIPSILAMNRPNYLSHASNLRKPSCSGLSSIRSAFEGLLLLAFTLVSNSAANGQSNYDTPYTFTTLAGSLSEGSADGIGSAASFNSPHGVAVDSGGNIYVADINNQNIRKITAEGVVTTLAGSGMVGSTNGTGNTASFWNPSGVAVDSGGNVYVADHSNNKIRKITAAGLVTTLAGSGAYGSADGSGTAASFNNPSGVAVDSGGNVYVAEEFGHKIRKITATGVVTTLAGSGISGNANGTGAAASFANPSGVAVDSGGNVYVADQYGQKIRKITATGVVTTLAGSGSQVSADGTGNAASFANPSGVAVDSVGNVYVAEQYGHKIRKITATGVVTTLAGSGISGNANGTGNVARFNYPSGVAVDSEGNIYVSDTFNNRICKGIATLPQNISFAALNAKTFGDSAFTLTARATSGLPITFSKVSGPASIFGNSVTITGAGTVVLRASQAGDNTYAAATPVDQSFIVAKANQNITFPVIADRPFGTGNVALSATASAGLPIVYSVVSGPATLSGSTLMVSGSGVITVKASQAGNSNYLPASDVTVNFTVSQYNTAAPSSITLSKNWFYDNAALNTEIGTLSATDPDAGDVFTYSLVTGIGSTDNAKFSMAGNRLWKASNGFNYDTQRTASIRIRVTDFAGQFYEQVIILNLVGGIPNAKFIPAGVPFTESPNYVNTFFQLVTKSTGRSISYPRSFFDSSSPDYQPDLFQVYEGATLSSSTTPIGFNESYFQVGKITDVPTKIRTVILLDTSSSISILDLAKIKDAAKVMVDNMFDQQEIAVYSFSGNHAKIQDFLGKSNANQATLKAAIDKIGRGNESTNLYGSMLAMLNLPVWVESFSTNGIETGFLVVLTDGADTSGSATKEQVIAKRDLDKKRIYTIGLGAAVEPAILQELQNTNFYIPASNAAVLAAAFENIQRDIIDLANSYYRINYISPKRLSNPLGTLRKMEVRLKNNTNTAADRMLSTAFNSDSFTSLGPAMYINRSVDKVAGISALAVSRDLPSSASAITLFPPLDFSNFTWSIGNPALATLTPRGTIGERVIITPKGQNGTTTLTLTDTISNFTKTIPLIIGSGSPLIAQTITFPALTSRLTTSSPFDLGASASSGLAVKFTLVSGPATLSGKKVTLTGRAGTVVIRTSQAGNATYAAATPVERSFAVTVPSSISTLSKLAVQGATLSPAFKTSTQTYTAKVANSKQSIKVTATAKSTSAKIAVNGTTAKSGTTKTIWLKVGRNPISIVVTAQNGSKRTYKITVTRAGAARSAPEFTPGPAGFALGEGGVSTMAAPRAVTSVDRIGGLKYLAIEIQKPAGQLLLRPRVEVSSNLVDWSSGKNHTTVLSETTAVLRVRDNTPLEPGSKRFIRVQPKSESFNGGGD